MCVVFLLCRCYAINKNGLDRMRYEGMIRTKERDSVWKGHVFFFFPFYPIQNPTSITSLFLYTDRGHKQGPVVLHQTSSSKFPRESRDSTQNPLQTQRHIQGQPSIVSHLVVVADRTDQVWGIFSGPKFRQSDVSNDPPKRAKNFFSFLKIFNSC